MKKIVFVLEHMLAGGVEKSLLSLIDNLPQDEYHITIMLVATEGDFIKEIPDRVNLKELPLSKDLVYDIRFGKNTSKQIKRAIKEKRYVKAVKILYQKVIKKDPLAKYGVDFSKLPSVSEEYDVAVCYHIHCPFLVRYVIDRIKSNCKVAWVHNDFYTTHYNIKPFKSEFGQYERIYCVSKQLKDEFIAQLPEYQNKVKLFTNIISEAEINRKADEYYPIEYDGCSVPIIVTLGRLNHQKGIDTAIKISRRLTSSGLLHKWFVIGEGELRESLEELILAEGVSEEFKLIGVRLNPYPYLKHCTIYVQPSRHEGYGIAVAEARCLNVPIVCSDFAGAREQIVPDKTGIIVPFDEELLFEKIKCLLENTSMQHKLSEELIKEKQSHKMGDELLDFLRLIG